MLLLLILLIIIVWLVVKTISTAATLLIIGGLISFTIAAVVIDKALSNNKKYKEIKRAWNEMDENSKYALKAAAIFIGTFLLIYISLEIVF